MKKVNAYQNKLLNCMMNTQIFLLNYKIFRMREISYPKIWIKKSKGEDASKDIQSVSEIKSSITSFQERVILFIIK